MLTSTQGHTSVSHTPRNDDKEGILAERSSSGESSDDDPDNSTNHTTLSSFDQLPKGWSQEERISPSGRKYYVYHGPNNVRLTSLKAVKRTCGVTMPAKQIKKVRGKKNNRESEELRDRGEAKGHWAREIEAMNINLDELQRGVATNQIDIDELQRIYNLQKQMILELKGPTVAHRDQLIQPGHASSFTPSERFSTYQDKEELLAQVVRYVCVRDGRTKASRLREITDAIKKSVPGLRPLREQDVDLNLLPKQALWDIAEVLDHARIAQMASQVASRLTSLETRSL